MKPNRPTTRHFIIKIVKIKDKQRILKEARKRQLVIYEEAHIRFFKFLNGNFADQNGVTGTIHSNKKQGLTTETTQPSNAVI